MSERSNLQEGLDLLERVNDLKEDMDLYFMLMEEGEPLLSEACEVYNKYYDAVNKALLEIHMSGEYDSCNAYLNIKSGAGGLEAEDWALMVFRMYVGYLDKEGLSYDMISSSYGDQQGLKQITLHVKGNYAYGKLKHEQGNHRLTRVSPYDEKARRQTSFCGITVTPEIDAEFSESLDWKEIRIDLYRSSGPGGQHANKVATGVRLTHEPTGLVASCQSTRSQGTNKERAIKMLQSKLMLLQKEAYDEKVKDAQGEKHVIGWGRRIRSYSFAPQHLVKDHRTNHHTSDLEGVLNGNLQPFITSHIIKSSNEEKMR